MRTIEQQIGKQLANMDGGAFGFVCIWREIGDPLDDGADHCRKCTVGEFLGRPENQKGIWLIDDGNGGPPGPIYVRWDERSQEWENGGFRGLNFPDDKSQQSTEHCLICNALLATEKGIVRFYQNNIHVATTCANCYGSGILWAMKQAHAEKMARPDHVLQ